MSDTKIFSFPDGGGHGSFGGGSAMEGAMLGSMMGNGGMGGGNGMWNNPWWALIFLAAFRNNGGLFGGDGNNGCGGNTQARFDALQEQLSTIQGQNALQSAIQGGTNEVKALASTLNCDINAVQAAINAVQGAICQLGNTIGLGQRDIIAAINSGNCQLATQLSSCCCGIQDAITRGNYENQISNLTQTSQLQGAINFVNSSVERGFASTAFETANQTCELKNAIAAQTQVINDKFCQLEMREMARENRDLRDQVQAYRLSDSQRAQTSEIINTIRPCPTPAFITCNPWATTGGYYGNGYGYGYGYNDGGNCGCNG